MFNQNFNYDNLVTRVSQLPVSIADIKAQLAYGGYSDDSRLLRYATAAVEWIEWQYNIAILTQQRTFTVPTLYSADWHHQWNLLFPFVAYPLSQQTVRGHGIRFPFYPVISFDGANYWDTDGNYQTYATSNFLFQKDGRYFSNVRIKPNLVIPSTYEREDAWTLTYTASSGTSTLNNDGSVTTTVPAGIVQAILVICSTFNESREGEQIGTIVTPVYFDVQRLIAPYVMQGVLA